MQRLSGGVSNTIDVYKIREFTHALAAALEKGGEVVIYKGTEPYRYMNIRPIRVIANQEGGLTDEDYEERLSEAKDVNKEKILLGDE